MKLLAKIWFSYLNKQEWRSKKTLTLIWQYRCWQKRMIIMIESVAELLVCDVREAPGPIDSIWNNHIKRYFFIAFIKPHACTYRRLLNLDITKGVAPVKEAAAVQVNLIDLGNNFCLTFSYAYLVNLVDNVHGLCLGVY